MSKIYHDQEYLKIELLDGVIFTIKETYTEQSITLVEDDIDPIITALTQMREDIERTRKEAQMLMVLMGMQS